MGIAGGKNGKRELEMWSLKGEDTMGKWDKKRLIRKEKKSKNVRDEKEARHDASEDPQ